MSSRPALASAVPASSVDLARQQIERLVHDRLAGKQITAVEFVEDLLDIAAQVGDVSCQRAADHGLRFQLAGGEPFEVELDHNRGKLRMLCARLAVLCQESGHDLMLYGGQGTIRRTNKLDSAGGGSNSSVGSPVWNARWTNTPDSHEFTITILK